jgi:hypothetical protein
MQPESSTLSKPTAAIAVVVGAAVGYGLSYAVLFTSGLVFLWGLVFSGIHPNEAYAKAYESTAYLVFAHMIGFACLVPGGLWAAKLSQSSATRNAFAAGVVVIFFAALANLVPYYLPIPYWSRVVSLLAPVPAFLLGAYMHRNAA